MKTLINLFAFLYELWKGFKRNHIIADEGWFYPKNYYYAPKNDSWWVSINNRLYYFSDYLEGYKFSKYCKI